MQARVQAICKHKLAHACFFFARNLEDRVEYQWQGGNQKENTRKSVDHDIQWRG